jgi:hypothetical protein
MQRFSGFSLQATERHGMPNLFASRSRLRESKTCMLITSLNTQSVSLWKHMAVRSIKWADPISSAVADWQISSLVVTNGLLLISTTLRKKGEVGPLTFLS